VLFKRIIVALILVLPDGIAQAAKTECPKQMIVDGQAIPLFSAKDAMGRDGYSNALGSPQVDFGYGSGKEIIDLGSLTDRHSYFPKYLACDYLKPTLGCPPTHHTVVILPDDVKECVRQWRPEGHYPVVVKSMHCARMDGGDAGAEVFPSEPMSEQTTISGFRLGMTEAQAQDAAKAKGYVVAEGTVGGETVMHVANGEDGYPMRIVFSATTGTARQVVVIDPSGDDDDSTLLFRFVKRFGPGAIGGGETHDLPPNFHPAMGRVSPNVTPVGAV
jgi:hypothetical protein